MGVTNTWVSRDGKRVLVEFDHERVQVLNSGGYVEDDPPIEAPNRWVRWAEVR
ncbi:hypothetical protein [Amycolatopsis anabasis]|uniref:hypothetical protein n=1 Tax=Amycolatopsis anabasis TaxID=1840409 RepID=UPI00131C0755|nr:hypothetical protein [Amycolatopsis anabasis]